MSYAYAHSMAVCSPFRTANTMERASDFWMLTRPPSTMRKYSIPLTIVNGVIMKMAKSGWTMMLHAHVHLNRTYLRLHIKHN